MLLHNLSIMIKHLNTIIYFIKLVHITLYCTRFDWRFLKKNLIGTDGVYSCN
jgi:hypothetical protein